MTSRPMKQLPHETNPNGFYFINDGAARLSIDFNDYEEANTELQAIKRSRPTATLTYYFVL